MGAGAHPPGGPPVVSPVVDTHVHVVSADHERFPLAPTGLGRTWWTEPERDHAALLGAMDACHVDAALLVQPVGAYGYDNSYVLDAVESGSGRLRAVPAIDLDAAEAADHIRRVSHRAGVVGVRLFGVGAGARWPADAEALDTALAAARDAGLTAVLTLFRDHLPALTPVLRRHPEITVALDHCAFPEIVDGRLAPGSPLLALRDAEHVLLKVSSHLLYEAGADGAPRLVSELVQAFGPGRLAWGSDHPQTGGDYGELVDLARAACRDLDGHQRSAFFGANAAAAFSVPVKASGGPRGRSSS